MLACPLSAAMSPRIKEMRVRRTQSYRNLYHLVYRRMYTTEQQTTLRSLAISPVCLWSWLKPCTLIGYRTGWKLREGRAGWTGCGPLRPDYGGQRCVSESRLLSDNTQADRLFGSSTKVFKTYLRPTAPPRSG